MYCNVRTQIGDDIKYIYDSNAVLDDLETVEDLTDKVCGNSKNIVDIPIVVDIYSHTCPDLTLVDLPGITRIAIKDQP